VSNWNWFHLALILREDLDHPAVLTSRGAPSLNCEKHSKNARTNMISNTFFIMKSLTNPQKREEIAITEIC
jgi:hypothetical protein